MEVGLGLRGEDEGKTVVGCNYMRNKLHNEENKQQNNFTSFEVIPENHHTEACT